jgi:hypothetical protein
MNHGLFAEIGGEGSHKRFVWAGFELKTFLISNFPAAWITDMNNYN